MHTTDLRPAPSIYSILIMIGGLMGIISVFLTWISIDFSLWTFTMTGWEVVEESFSGTVMGDLAGSYAQWMPLIVLTFSAAALIMGAAALIRPRNCAAAGSIICGGLVVAANILFCTYDGLYKTAGGGIYLAAAAGFVIAVFGVLRMPFKFSLGSTGLFKRMMLIGSVLGVVSVFQYWFCLDYVILRFDYTGYDFYVKSLSYPAGYPGIGHYAYMPLIVLAGSASAAIASLLTFTKHEKKGAIAGTCLGAAIFISTLVYVFYPESKIVISTQSAVLINEMSLMDHLGPGVYSALIASAFLVLSGIIVLTHRKAVSDAQEEEQLH